MKDFLIEKRFKAMSKNGYFSNDQNNLLLEEYFQDLKNGVSPENSEARALLVLGNNKLILHTIKTKFQAKEIFDEDVVSVGKVALLKAIDTFNSEKNIEFSSYAVGCIWYELLNYFRNLRNKGQMPEQQIFLGDYINEGADADSLISLGETIADDEDVTKSIQDKCLIENIVKSMRYLTKAEVLTVISMHGLFDYPKLTQNEIAEKLNLSRTSIATYYTRGLKKLKVLNSKDDDLTINEKRMRERVLKQAESCELINED